MSKNVLEKIRAEIHKSLLIKEEKKGKLLAAAEKMSPVALECFFEQIVTSNRYFDECLTAAANSDTEKTYLHELITKVKKIRKQTLFLEEESQNENLDEILEKK
jgi:hypothetical protein